MQKLLWHNEKRKVNDLLPCPHNPRKWSEKQLDDLKKSIDKLGYAEIVAINTDNMLCAGHMRVEALKQLDRQDENIDVRVPNRKLTQKEFDEYLLSSNKKKGDWDFDELANFDEDILKDSGFNEDEFKNIFDLDIDNKNRKDVDLKDIFQIIIECSDEINQRKIYKKLSKEGYKCRVFTL